MKINRKLVSGFAATALLAGMQMSVQAKISAEEAAKLGVEGTPLTPMGAERAGNADGTIPAWTGGITEIPAGFVAGGNYVDPYADDEKLFTITADNYQQYEANLTAGQIELFKKYPDTYRMHVYPSRRSASYPDWVYERTIAQAEHAEVCDGSREKGEVCISTDLDGGGIPFPIPADGIEAGWNHIMAFRGQYGSNYANAPLINKLGARTDVVIQMRETSPWWLKNDKLPNTEWFSRDGGAYLCDSWQIIQPPRSSGLVFGGCGYINEPDFNVYLYIPGQRRVRKAPEIGFHDSPSFGSDGLRIVSARWQWWFGGKKPRHNIELTGKKEIYVPYNPYNLARADLPLDDIIGDKHIKSDVLRYELHRVWEIDTTLKEGERHLFKRHVAYFDEDTWLGVAYDGYDHKDRLWRVGEQYNLNFYDQGVVRAYGDGQYDLVNGRYTTFPGWFLQAGYGAPNFVDPVDMSIFTPSGLRKFGTR